MSGMPSPKSSSCRTRMELVFGGEIVVLDASGALYLPGEDALVVADLHLEKGSFFASRGNPVPCLDTRDTLIRLSAIVAAYRPRRLICLGDSFHDMRAVGRMRDEDAARLKAVISAVADWVWISGNHDPEAPDGYPANAMPSFSAGPISLCHRPEDGAAPVIAGHYHPKHSIRAGDRKLTARCFVIGGDLLLMPAFGSYTGGLRSASEPISALFGGASRQYVLLYGDKLWAVR